MATVSLGPQPTPTLQDRVATPPAITRRSAHAGARILFCTLIAVAACGLHSLAWLFPGAWYCVWFGQAALIGVGAMCRPKYAFLLGTLIGTVAIAGAFHWGIEALKLTIDASTILAWTVFLALMTFEGVSFGLFCLAVSRAARGGLLMLWLAPFAWAALEAWYPRLFRWQIAYSQLEVIPLLQITDLVGSPAVGFVVTAVAAIPTVLWLARGRSAADRRNAVGSSAAAAALLAATLVYGHVRERQVKTAMATQPKLRVGLIQVDPAIVGAEPRLRERTLEILDQVDLVCWPESAIGTYSQELGHFRDSDSTLQQSFDSQLNLRPAKDFARHLLAGGKDYRNKSEREGPYSMTAFLISPEEEILGRYRKRTLMPFGEYVPGQTIYPHVRDWCNLSTMVEAGTDPRPLITGSGQRLGVLICYEDTLPGNARATVAAGASVLFSLIQGTAFENPLTLEQHFRLAALRAVENRRYFLRCASTGITCIVAPTGEIIARLPPQADGTLVGEVAMMQGRTLYNLTGDSFAWLCVGVTMIGLAVARRRSRAALSAS